MSKVSPPPTYDTLVNEDGKPSNSWLIFFDKIWRGDSGNAWTPTFQNLTTVGTPTISGTYYKISQSLVYFRVLITPATNTSATAGSTYIDNFPLNIRADGGFFVVTGTTAAAGVASAGDKRLYMPSWTTIATPITISGTIEAS